MKIRLNNMNDRFNCISLGRLMKRDPFGLREDWETLQPEGWRPYSDEVWGMSQSGPNTPSWYPYVEGIMVAGPATAFVGAGAGNDRPVDNKDDNLRRAL